MLRILSLTALAGFALAAAASAADEPASQPDVPAKVQIKLVAATEKPAENAIPCEPWIAQAVAKASLGGAGDAGDWTDVGAQATAVVSWPPLARRFNASVRKDSGDAFLVVSITGDATKTVMLLNQAGQQELLKADSLPRAGTLYLAVRVVPADAKVGPLWGEKVGETRMHLRSDPPRWPAKGNVALIGLYEHTGETTIPLPTWGSEGAAPLVVTDAAGKAIEPAIGKVEIPKKDRPDQPDAVAAGSVKAVLLTGEIADGVLTVKNEAVGKSWSWKLPADSEIALRATPTSDEVSGIASQTIRVQTAK